MLKLILICFGVSWENIHYHVAVVACWSALFVGISVSPVSM